MASLLAHNSDGLDDLMELESEFYDEGYRTGLEDGNQAGLIEGKLFGIENGYGKVLEMGRLRGRATVWDSRLSETRSNTSGVVVPSQDNHNTRDVAASLPGLGNNDRLRKQVNVLIALVNGKSLDMTNSDDAVTAYDDLMVKARNKAKVISNMTGEPLSMPAADKATGGIEDAGGLSARRSRSLHCSSKKFHSQPEA